MRSETRRFSAENPATPDVRIWTQQARTNPVAAGDAGDARGSGAATSGALPFQAGASNLAVPEAEAADLARRLGRLPGLPPLGDEAVLSPGEIERRRAETAAFIRQLGTLAPGEVPPLGEAPLASASMETWGAMAAGAASYCSAFFPGKIASSLVSLWSPLLGAWTFPAVASVLHAMVGENLAGGVRTNYAAVASPDGTAWANYNTALGRLSVAEISGTPAAIAQASAQVDAVVKSVTDRVAAELAKEQAGTGTSLWTPFSDPMTSAALRAFVTDELPFIVFSISYTALGAVLPNVRAALGGTDPSDRAAHLAVDILATGAFGALAGMGTVLTQNAMRKRVQHAAPARAGIHSAPVREQHYAQVGAQIGLLHHKRATLNAVRDDLLARRRNQALAPHEQELLALVDDALKENLRLLTKCCTKHRRLRTLIGRNAITSDRLFAASLCGAPKSNPEFLNGGPMQRRVAAKACGKFAALMPYVLYMIWLANRTAQALPLDMLDPPDGSQPDPHRVDEGISDLLAPSMAAGWVLVACWVTHFLWTPIIEDFFNVAEGDRRLVMHLGRDREDPVAAQAPRSAGTPRGESAERKIELPADADADALGLEGLDGLDDDFEDEGDDADDLAGDHRGLAADLLLWTFQEPDWYPQAMKLAAAHLAVHEADPEPNASACRLLVMRSIAQALERGWLVAPDVQAMFGQLDAPTLEAIIDLPVDPIVMHYAIAAGEVLQALPSPSSTTSLARGGRPLHQLGERELSASPRGFS